MKNRNSILKLSMAMFFILFALRVTYDTAYAKKQYSHDYVVEQTEGKMPNAKIYIGGKKMSEDSKFIGTITDEQTGSEYEFDQNAGAVRFKDSGEGIHYIFLFDDSSSIDKGNFKEAKNQIVKTCKNLRANDDMTIFKVGSHSGRKPNKKPYVSRFCGSDKDKVKKCIKAVESIKQLPEKKSHTVLYKTLNEVVCSQKTEGKRTVIIMVSDGVDDSKGRNSGVETLSNLQKADVPLYGILLASKKNNKKTKEYDYTFHTLLDEENGRGVPYDATKNSISVKKGFDWLMDFLMNQIYVVNMTTDTNKVLGSREIVLKADGGETIGNDNNPIRIDMSEHTADTTTPVLKDDIKVDKSGKSITFTLSDEYGVNSADASNKGCYKVQTKKEKENTLIKDVKAVAMGKETKVTLDFAERLYNVEYTLDIKNIHDTSQEANMTSHLSKDFKVKTGVNKTTAEFNKKVKSYWWIALLMMVLIIGLIIIVILRKKSTYTDVSSKLSEPDDKMFKLVVTDLNNQTYNREVMVSGSFFVGRGNDVCDLAFPGDTGLSMQHFVIEVTKKGCYINDLDSTNGTFVNGVKVVGRRELADGDVLMAGRERIVFYLPEEHDGFVEE